MPFKLIGFIVILVFVTIFSGFNLDNRCDINLIFHTFAGVPISFSLLLAFTAGMVIMLPYAFARRLRGKTDPKIKEKGKQKSADTVGKPASKPIIVEEDSGRTHV
jgi:uncharacterized integral membrane protein